MTIGSMLPSDADELLGKAAAQLRAHLETGNDCCVETILSDFPSLASDSRRAVALIVLEIHLRRQQGQNPDPEQWYERFPQWREELRLRLQGLALSSIATAERETATEQTSSYSGADRPTAVDMDGDPPVLGRHEILEEIGRGGMGVVYRARDRVLDRIVALKAILSGRLASSEEVRRFYQEARAAALLRHPNIVPIYGMGLHEGLHCFTMGLFPKGSLGQHLKDYHRDIRRSVEVAAKVARAVQAAHERGIIHRDLKPGNILLDENGEPVVSDFGLAKRLDVSVTMTLPNHPLGTPAYMAPEQARGERVTLAADIWALGVILYELLTGRRPFTGKDADEVRQQVLHADPPSPRRLRRDLPRDLETIVLKCLEKEPKRRYGSAAEFAEDLERWMRGAPIQAWPESRWHRLRRHFRRRVGMKGVLLLLIGLLLMGAGAAGVWGIFSYLSPEARERRTVEAIQRDLDAGKPVTLIGEIGPPKLYRNRLDKHTQPSVSKLPNKPFGLFAMGAYLVELLPDPKQQHYRFSAEARAVPGSNFPDPKSIRFGIFFQADEQGTPLGTEQRCCVFSYGRIGVTTLMQAFCLCCLEPEFADGWLKPWNGALLTQTMNQPLTDWHEFAVEVAPDGFVAFFDGCQVGEFKLWEGALQPGLEDWWTKIHGLAVPPPSPPFSPCGAIGLYVENGDVEFRNVVVKPLAEK